MPNKLHKNSKLTPYQRRYAEGLNITAFDVACKQLGIKHKLTKPYKTQTNGLMERLIGKIDLYVVNQYKATCVNDLLNGIVRFLVCYHYSYHSSLHEKLTHLLNNKDPAEEFIEKLKKSKD